MTQFDQEMLTFKEIIHRYKPIKGFHLVLDLADYKSGKESLGKYKFGCRKYRQYVNSECHEKNIDIVIITSNMGNQITYRSKFLYAKYCYDRNEFIEIEDPQPFKMKIKRTMRQEIELLFFELNNPQPIKPIC